MALKLYDIVAIQVQFRSPLYFVWSMYTYICLDVCDPKGSRPVKLLILDN
jgi:hypothetical protein